MKVVGGAGLTIGLRFSAALPFSSSVVLSYFENELSSTALIKKKVLKGVAIRSRTKALCRSQANIRNGAQQEMQRFEIGEGSNPVTDKVEEMLIDKEEEEHVDTEVVNIEEALVSMRKQK